MAAPQTTLILPDGRQVTLRRHPSRPQPDNLRAWDAADELALLHLAGEAVELTGAPAAPVEGRTVLVNDDFGALAAGLAGRRPVSWADSALAWNATAANVAANGLAEDAVDLVPADQPPPAAGLVVIKVPKGHDRLEHQLRAIAGTATPGAMVVGAGMTRHIHSRTVALFESLIGPTRTTKARKKARLILATVDPARRPATTDEATTHQAHGITVVGLPGVFGADATDDGTELLLAHLPAAQGKDVVDLGCGTGIVGTVVARDNPSARLTFTDVSHLAVASARRTLAETLPGRDATFHVADALEACPDGSADLVVVNPPFHQGRVVTDDVAWEMFGDARRVLRPGGRIVAVGNRHLGYHAKLNRLYGNVEVFGSDPRFVVVASLRR